MMGLQINVLIVIFLVLCVNSFAGLAGAVDYQEAETVSDFPATPGLISPDDHVSIEALYNRGDIDLLVPPQLRKIPSAAFAPGEIIVKFTEDSTVFLEGLSDGSILGSSEFVGFNEACEITAVKPVINGARFSPLQHVYKIYFDSNADADQLIDYYSALPFVEYAERNYQYSVFTHPNDEYFELQWGLNASSDCDVDAPEAWNVTVGNDSVVVAVIDTGIDYNHSELCDNIWNNTDELINGSDDDSNGYIDDIRGWDFYNNDSDPRDDHGHGTHCAGIIGALGNNSIGIAGVSWNCSIMPVKAFSSYGGGYADDIANAVYYAVDNGADVLSMSFGAYTNSELISDSIEYAYNNGVICVAAAGNSHTDMKSYPAGYANVIAVAATNQSDIKASFSNYGSWVDIAAPGVNIFSTMPSYDVSLTQYYGYTKNYSNLSGTSMACPFVAGVCSLLLARNASYDFQQVQSILKSSADAVSSDYYIGQGRLNAYQAVLRESVPKAILAESLANSEISGVLDITGTANGSLFANYTVYYGTGLYPSNWTACFNGSIMVNNSVLGSWNTSNVSDGDYSLRLVVNDTNGFSAEDQLVVEVNNVITTLYVGGSGLSNYSTIGAAVDDAGTGDTIFVYNGTYYDHLMITKNITLMGESYSNTIIDGNFSFEYMYGIWVDAGHCNISNITVKENLYGIVYTQSTRSVVKYTCMNYSVVGIYLISTVQDYEVNNSNFSGGILYNNFIQNNVIVDSLIGIACQGNKTLIANNSICGSFGGYGVYGLFGDNSTVRNNSVVDQLCAVYLYSHDGGVVSNNSAYNCSVGIMLESSYNNSVCNNTLDSGELGGVYIAYSSDNLVYDNVIMNMNDTGMNISFSSYNNVVYHNDFVNNEKNAWDDGVNLWNVSYPSGGNYWHNFSGPDEYFGPGQNITGCDNISDCNYSVAGGVNVDCYPWLRPLKIWDDLVISVSSEVDENTDFTVAVTANGSAVENVSVSFAGSILLTDASGDVTFTAPAVGSDTVHVISVSLRGYAGNSTSLTVKNVVSNPNPGPSPGSPGPSTVTVVTQPDTPTITGVSEGFVNLSYTYTANSSDPDGHDIRYYFDWGDGTFTDWTQPAVSSGTAVSVEHRWSAPGSYGVTVKAVDSEDSEQSEFCDPFIVIIAEYVDTQPPNKPEVPDGPTSGVTCYTYSFVSRAVDPDGDMVQYRFDWDDETSSQWGYPVESGSRFIQSHNWSKAGNYSIRVQARDTFNVTSAWSDALLVVIELDSDGDGWSDTIEYSYATNWTNVSDFPVDTDGDWLPDEDSSDGNYSGDTDDDNDNLSDVLEELLGTNPKDGTDVIMVEIQGVTHFLLNVDTHEFDFFYNTSDGTLVEVAVTVTGEYLIDDDNDRVWDYVYDPLSGDMQPYEVVDETWELPVWLIIGLIVILGIFVVVGILYKTGYIKIWREFIFESEKKK